MTRRTASAFFALCGAILLCSAVFLVTTASAAPPPPPPGPQIDFGKVWAPQGPAPIINGQTENLPSNGVGPNEVVGALHSVLTSPTDPDTILVGGVHGGVWRTTNATAASPTWTRTTPDLGPQAIASLQYDPTDVSNNTIIAGVGYMSAFSTGQVNLPGVLRSTDAGLTWTAITDPILVGENIIAAAARGPNLVAGSNARLVFLDAGVVSLGAGRLMRSTNTGATWATVSGTPGTLVGGGSFPLGAIFDIQGDPNSATRLYCTVEDTGIFRSDDSGATWRNVSSSDATLDGIITAASNNNAEMSVSPNGRLWVVVMQNGQAAYIGFSDDADTAVAPTWTEMDLPLTTDSGGSVGLNPRVKPGSQGATHLSILAGLDNTTVYVGGDRQPAGAGGFFPNSIGAGDFSGRLFRGDSTVAAVGPGAAAGPFSPQWEHLTHVQNLGFVGGGTPNSTAPHADSRDMAFDANGNIIEVDDGGVNRRASPVDNTGDWASMDGNLQVTEAHDVVYDTVSQILMTGNQDTGTTFQTVTGSMTWTSAPLLFVPGVPFSTGDGGDVNVDAVNPGGGVSTRYSSFFNLGTWRRQTYNAANAITGEMFPTLIGAVGGPQFKTPVELNRVNPLRLIVGGTVAIESMDQGDNFVGLGTGPVNLPGAIAYGAGGNAEALYVASGNTVFVRMAAGLPAVTPTPFPGGYARDIEMNPANPMAAYFVTNNSVWQTPDGGTTWNNITGDLAAVGGGNSIRTVTYVPNPTDDGILVGTRTGVYGTLLSNLGVWYKVGTGHPDVPIWELRYYPPPDDLLVSGTMGHGVWTTPMLTVPTDVTPPVLNCNILRTLLYPPFRALLPIMFTATATDNQPPNPIVQVTVYSDEPDGAAPFAPDATGTMPANTLLRAERMFPGGNGRIYIVRVDAYDAAGNRTTICKSVVVPTIPTLMNIMAVRMEAMVAEGQCAANLPGVAPAGAPNLLLCYQAP